MDSIVSVKTDVSDVVERSVTNAFDVMFRRGVAKEAAGDGFAEGAGQEISSCVSLWQEDRLNMDFSFSFDRDLLSAIVKEAYPQENHDRTLLCEDIACAVANIVVSNVKTYLNGRGFEMKMNIPEKGAAAANGGQMAYLCFRCDPRAQGGRILVNMQMQDRRGPKAG